MQQTDRPVVTYSMTRRVAVVTIDNPPVNALSSRVRAKLAKVLADAAPNRDVDAIVITCQGNTFVAGAEIRELGRIIEPSAPDLLSLVEYSEKPVIAAIHGSALGGGLELALSCHWRVCVATARLGLPEINLGLIPGAGGTQRLPRVVGIKSAAQMILSGKAVDATAAWRSGLVDAVWDDKLVERAVAFAESIAAAPVADRRARSRPPPTADPDVEKLIREIAGTAEAARRAPTACEACIAALTAAPSVDFEQGMRRERALFLDLLANEESRSLRALFFAERAAKRVRDVDAGTHAREVSRIAVVGAGTMGRGIAIACADVGYTVLLIESESSQRQIAKSMIDAHYASLAARGRITESRAKEALARLQISDSLTSCASADLVIEAAFEDLEIKQDIFAQLDSITPPGVILATNTSTLDVNRIAAATRRPGDVLGMHFFSPANVMRLLEVVRGSATSPEALKTVLVVGGRLGKLCVAVGVCDGFVGNRMSARRARQIELMLQEGALPQQIDEAARLFGFAMGPCAATDLAGLDISWRVRKSKGMTAPIADALCERRRFGQKARAGYYAYPSGGRSAVPDPEVEILIREISSRLSVTRRALSSEEIVDRLILPMVNEGARILEESIAERPGDIDLVWVNGFGWPARRGGPMIYADALGLPVVCDRLEALASSLGDESLRPTGLLKRLAATRSSFHDPQATQTS